MEVLELTRQPTVEAWKLKQCIEKDPALTAKLLRVVNSALFGLSRSVSDLTQALAILGSKPLKLLVLGFSLPEKLFQQTSGEFLARYWQRTLVKAVAARELAAHMPRVSGDEAFIAALLQDLGILVLIHDLGAHYVVLREAAEAAGSDARLWERSALGFDHTQLSSRLLSHWQLPEAIVAAARLPASPDELASEACRQQPLRQLVYLADLLSQVLLDRRSEALQELLEGIRASTSLDEPQLARLVDELEQKVAQLAEVLSLELPGQVDYGELLKRAFAALTPLAASAAGELVQLRRQTSLEQADDWSQSTVGQSLKRRLTPRMAALAASMRTPAHAMERLRVEPSPAIVANSLPMECDASLVVSLASAITACRQRRVPISLMLASIDEASIDGLEHRDAVLARLASFCRGLDHVELRCHPLRGTSVAVVLANCDRQQAVRLGQRLLDAWRRQTADAAAPLSIGLAAVALAPRNFPAPELIAAASRCLSGAQSSGGNCLKSVEL
jgi:HD-like signal output (HDOD) protein/GGDEF domain-containing protein